MTMVGCARDGKQKAAEREDDCCLRWLHGCVCIVFYLFVLMFVCLAPSRACVPASTSLTAAGLVKCKNELEHQTRLSWRHYSTMRRGIIISIVTFTGNKISGASLTLPKVASSERKAKGNDSHKTRGEETGRWN